MPLTPVTPNSYLNIATSKRKTVQSMFNQLMPESNARPLGGNVRNHWRQVIDSTQRAFIVSNMLPRMIALAKGKSSIYFLMAEGRTSTELRAAKRLENVN